MIAKISGRLTVKSSLLTFVYGLGSWIHLNKVGPSGGTFHQKKQGGYGSSSYVFQEEWKCTAPICMWSKMPQASSVSGSSATTCSRGSSKPGKS